MLRSGPKHNLINLPGYCERRSEYLAQRTIEYGQDGLPTKENKIVLTQYMSFSFVYKELDEIVTLILPNQDRGKK